MPEPFLRIIGLDIDKSSVYAGSGGDFLVNFGLNISYSIGRFQTGSWQASSFIMWGNFYPIIIVLLLIPTFSIFDSLVHVNIFSEDKSSAFSVMGGTNLFSYTFYLTSAATGIESFSGLFMWLVRGWLQVMLVWFVALLLTNFLFGTARKQ